MLGQGIELTLIGITSVFAFLILLITFMYAQSFIFEHLGITDSEPQTSEDEDALVALAIAVKLKNS